MSVPSSIAIEIDRTNKLFSLAKLEAALARRDLPIWIRWGGTSVVPVTEGIHVIDLTVGWHGQRKLR